MKFAKIILACIFSLSLIGLIGCDFNPCKSGKCNVCHCMEGGDCSCEDCKCDICHCRIHDGQIVIDRKYSTTNAKWVLHYWEKGEEKWK